MGIEAGAELATMLAVYLRQRSTGSDLASRLDDALLARMLKNNAAQRSFSIFGVQVCDGVPIRDDHEPYPGFFDMWMARHHPSWPMGSGGAAESSGQAVAY